MLGLTQIFWIVCSCIFGSFGKLVCELTIADWSSLFYGYNLPPGWPNRFQKLLCSTWITYLNFWKTGILSDFCFFAWKKWDNAFCFNGLNSINCKEELEMDQPRSSYLLKLNQQTESTILRAHISDGHCTFCISVLSCHAKANKLIRLAFLSHWLLSRFCELLTLRNTHLQYIVGTRLPT